MKIKLNLHADDDSEPILGHWFEETLSLKEPVTESSPQPTDTVLDDEADNEDNETKCHQRMSSSDSPCLIHDKHDPEGVSIVQDIYIGYP